MQLICVSVWSKATLTFHCVITDPTRCARCYTVGLQRKKETMEKNTTDLLNVSFQTFGLSRHLHTNTILSNMQHIPLSQTSWNASPAFSSKSFNRTNSDFFYSQAHCAVQLRNGCRVWQRWFSSPVYSAFLCRSCVFFNKEHKTTVWGSSCRLFHTSTSASMYRGVEVRQSLHLVMI